MTKVDERIDRIEAAIERLEALGLTGPVVSPSAVNPDGSPGFVAPGELIESAWGNAVSNEFNRIRAGHKQTNTASGPYGALAAVPGLSLPAQFVSDRLYKLSAHIAILATSATGIAHMRIVDSGSTPLAVGEHTTNGNAEFSLDASVLLTGATGPNTLTVQLSFGPGGMTIPGGVGANSYILLEEISKRFAT